MLAVVFDQFGPPDVLHIGEIAEHHAGPGEIRVRVHAAGVSPVDAGVRSGSPLAQQRVVFSHVPGVDVAGTVDEIGAGVTGLTIGADVFGAVDVAKLGGATAQFAVLRFWAAKPASMSWAEAGAAGTSTETATRVLDILALKPGQTLLVDGAAGGVGSILLQLASARGLQLIGTSRPSNFDFLRELHAVPVEYGPGLDSRVRHLGLTVDGAIDVAGAGSLPELIALTGSPERVVTIADFSASTLGVCLSMGRMGGEAGGEHGLSVAAGLSVQGRFRVPVQQVFAAGDSALAHAAVEAGSRRGKIVIAVDW